MTKEAIIESIKNARIELDQLKHSPMQRGFTGTKAEIINFIIRMKKELNDTNSL